MSSLNKVQLIGNLGADPEVRYTQSGIATATLSVATTESWKDKDGNKQERTEWHRVVLYRRLAEVAGEYLRKGSSVYLEGKLQTRKWQDQNGQDRYTTEVVADEMKMLGGKPQGNGQGSGNQPPPQQSQNRPQQSQPQNRPSAPAQSAPPPYDGDFGFAGPDDDIPF